MLQHPVDALAVYFRSTSSIVCVRALWRFPSFAEGWELLRRRKMLHKDSNSIDQDDTNASGSGTQLLLLLPFNYIVCKVRIAR